MFIPFHSTIARLRNPQPFLTPERHATTIACGAVSCASQIDGLTGANEVVHRDEARRLPRYRARQRAKDTWHIRHSSSDRYALENELFLYAASVGLGVVLQGGRWWTRKNARPASSLLEARRHQRSGSTTFPSQLCRDIKRAVLAERARCRGLGRNRLLVMLSRGEAVGAPSADGKLKNRCSLTLVSMVTKTFLPSGNSSAFVVLIGNVQINGAKSRYAELGALSP